MLIKKGLKFPANPLISIMGATGFEPIISGLYSRKDRLISMSRLGKAGRETLVFTVFPRV